LWVNNQSKNAGFIPAFFYALNAKIWRDYANYWHVYRRKKSASAEALWYRAKSDY